MGHELVCRWDYASLAKSYDLNLTPANDQIDIVVGGGWEHCGPKYKVERAGFKYYVIEFIIDGKGTLTLQDKKFPLYPGTLFLYGPGIFHKIETDFDKPLIKHYVIFSGAELIGQIKQSALFRIPLHASRPIRIGNVFEDLLFTGSTESRHRSEICLLLLKRLILYIDEAASPQKEPHSLAWRTYWRIRSYIDQNFLHIENLNQLALACHTDKAYCCRLFKRYTSETPLHMIIRLKMHHAADLMLTEPDLPVKQIAELSGYLDPYHFSRVFKHVFGVPPGAYIKMFRHKKCKT